MTSSYPNQIKVKLFRDEEEDRLEKNLQDFLNRLAFDNLIDIQYSFDYNRDFKRMEFSALVIYKGNQILWGNDYL